MPLSVAVITSQFLLPIQDHLRIRWAATINQSHLSVEDHLSSLSVKLSGRRFLQIPSPFSLPKNRRRILEWDVLGDEGLHLGRNQNIRPQPSPGTNRKLKPSEVTQQARCRLLTPSPGNLPHPVIGTMLPTPKEAQGGQNWGSLPSNSPPSGD